jgi:N-acetylglutamate synthase-like GNAT family acetyltransferase
MSRFEVVVAGEQHLEYVHDVVKGIEKAASNKKTGLAKRSAEYIKQKIEEGKSVIAFHKGRFAGYCYIESWGHDRFVANSGLIVEEEYRGHGLAKLIKKKAFELSRQKFPNAKLFGLTTGLAVMKINSELGYKPVTFSELTDDDDFWKGCTSCSNYDILQRTNRVYCLCTAMMYDPIEEKKRKEEQNPFRKTINACKKIIGNVQR